MTTLDDFTPDPTEYETPPRIRKARPVPHPYKNHNIGNIVVVYNRGETGVPGEDGERIGYWTPRTTQKNLFRKYNGYPISLPVLGNLQFSDVELVLVYERDKKNLYEFTLDQYLADETPEYDWDQYDDDGNKVRTDTQKCVNREEAVRTWDLTEWTKRDLWH